MYLGKKIAWKSNCPKVLEIVQRNFYIDDFIKSVPSEAEDMSVLEEIINCLKEKDSNSRNGFVVLSVLWAKYR